MERTFLTKEQLAAKMGTTPGIAARLLSEKGISPVDLGRGRGRGLRWYNPAVEVAMRQIHDDAQTKNPPSVGKLARLPKAGLVLGRSVNDLHAELTGGAKMQ